MADVREKLAFHIQRRLGLFACCLGSRVGLLEHQLGFLERGDVRDENDHAFNPTRLIDVRNVSRERMARNAGWLCQRSFKGLGLTRNRPANEWLVEREKVCAEQLLNRDAKHLCGRATKPFPVLLIRKSAPQVDVPVGNHRRELIDEHVQKAFGLGAPIEVPNEAPERRDRHWPAQQIRVASEHASRLSVVEIGARLQWTVTTVKAWEPLRTADLVKES